MRYYGRYNLIPVAVALILVLTLEPSPVGRTIRVCKIGCELDSIQEGLATASPGDTVKVQSGQYSENLRIGKELSIVGPATGGVRIGPEEGSSPTVVIGPSPISVELRNLSVTGGDKSRVGGILATGEARVTLVNCRIDGGGVGIRTRDSSYLKLRGGEVVDAEEGISASGNSELVLMGTRVSSNRAGLSATDNSEANIIDSEITNCDRHSILARDVARVNVLSSAITHNQAPGVEVKDFSRLKMENSQVSSNEGGGILLSNSGAVELMDNRITYNQKKNLAVISKECGFSGPTVGFFGEVKGARNEILPKNSETICPTRFSRITTSQGGGSSYTFKPSTYAFLGLIGVATLYFFISG